MKKIFSFYRVVFLLVLPLAIVVCKGCKPTPPPPALTADQIENKHASGVVLVKNTYYYTITFEGGSSIYFTGIDQEGAPENLTFDINEVVPKTIFGTGFFITKDGMLATNSHVVSPLVDVASVRSSIVEAIGELANECSKEVNNINENLGMLKLAILTTDSYSDEQELTETYNELQNKRESYQEFINMAQTLRGKDYQAMIHCDLGIAYNDTHVTSTTDFVGCIELKDNPEKDLAIIQLKDKVTPEGKYVFKIPGRHKSVEQDEDNNSEKSKTIVGKKVHMIGFNLGPSLALTEQGVKAQITSGEISQDTDATQIMYTIPSLPGSSGSPVIDERGRLVAVNYAGLSSTQSFNYGIKVNHLKKMLDEIQGN